MDPGGSRLCVWTMMGGCGAGFIQHTHLSELGVIVRTSLTTRDTRTFTVVVASVLCRNACGCSGLFDLRGGMSRGFLGMPGDG